ncbi:tryptophan halogenase family protein [Salinimonas sediminis]|uniref:Tryptophan 7-halogenase n=1 Tax=Salinimonas sediminis TaxID=2303538 RepID=A0A346NPY4_9ALTE|nr:tryptophan halogenase family protein [Salinimonas sediminis]AXR07591.1 tryptophan 7-halogenase [Salinimonas sediminis]
MTQPHHIIIAGGGTAGWMAANLLAHQLAAHPVRITLLESSDIATVGVGEGSTPTLKQFFRELGITDEQWMPACQATYKVGIEFRGWSPQSGIDSYRHPFISQLDSYSERPFQVNCHTRRLGLDVTTRPDKFLFNSYLGQAGFSPSTPPNFPFRIEYGYHFDAALLGAFLKQHALHQGVEHINCTIEAAQTHPDGSLKTLIDTKGQRHSADMFIDCTGFRGLLLQQTLKVPFEPFAANLFNNKAVVIATAAPARPQVETRSTALSSGWAWQIPLQHRTGNGYVYSDDYLSADAAETELRQHLRVVDGQAEARHLSMKVGQVKQHWFKNCLALGLAQGFIEPLEATALHLVQLSINAFCKHYIKGNFTHQEADAFNQYIRGQFANVRDYIVAHYKLNTRHDSAYWVDNRNNMQLSEPLLQLLDTWYRGKDLAAHLQQRHQHSHFNSTSWHCLLAGYGTFPPLAAQQPGGADMFSEHQLATFFDGCLLNFGPPLTASVG